MTHFDIVPLEFKKNILKMVQNLRLTEKSLRHVVIIRVPITFNTCKHFAAGILFPQYLIEHEEAYT